MLYGNILTTPQYISTTEYDKMHCFPPTHTPSDFFMPVIKILKSEVFHALSGLNPRKAYGPDGVPPIVLKNCASVLTPCLVNLIRLCLSTSNFPSCWKYAYVQPVPKKGNRSNPSTFRPIALISCLSKAFETILNREFLKHLSSFNILSDHQYGFRQGRSTGDLLAFLTDSWSSCLGETFAVALDISKAFDRVWHKALLSKLYPLTVSIPLSVVSFQVVLLLPQQTVTVLLLNLLIVVFLRALSYHPLSVIHQ